MELSRDAASRYWVYKTLVILDRSAMGMVQTLGAAPRYLALQASA